MDLKQKQKSTDIATDFLKHFIKMSIIQTKTAKLYYSQQKIPMVKEVDIKGNFLGEDETRAEFKKYIADKIPEPYKKREEDFLSKNIPEPPPSIQTSQAQISAIQPNQLTLQQKVSMETGLEKINEILSDPGVQSIECPGPEKKITINKSGRIEIIPLALTKEEISKITQFFSEKTKIPLLTGVFRANLANLSITAIISDFVGTRFILQKRMSF